METKRPFPEVPRPILTSAAVLGGIIGILLSDRFRWSAVQSFVFTLLIAGGCVLVAAFAYSALRGKDRQR